MFASVRRAGRAMWWQLELARDEHWDQQLGQF